MRFILMIGLIVCMPVSYAVAADDGGFGSSRFSATPPAALGGPAAVKIIGEEPETPAGIEPAAGDEEDITAPEEPLNEDQNLLNSNHTAEPYIIQKDMMTR